MPGFYGTLPTDTGAELPEGEDILTFYGTGKTFNIGIQAKALTEDWTLVLPNDRGTLGYLLQTDGGGQTSWVAPPAGTTTFLGLTDTPGSYVGQALQALRVNIGESALEFVPFPVGGGDMNKATYDIDDNGIVDGAEATIIQIRNVTGGTLLAGAPVRISGWDVGADVFEVVASDASDPLTMPASGVLFGDVTNNNNGFMIRSGEFSPFDTDVWSVGDILYVAPGGGLTDIRPDPATSTIQVIAVVARSHPSVGVLMIERIIIDHFFELVDTPDNYTGAGGQFVVVNGAENGLEFSPTAPSGSSAWESVAGSFQAVQGISGIEAGDNFYYLSRTIDGSNIPSHFFDTVDNRGDAADEIAVFFANNGASKCLSIARPEQGSISWYGTPGTTRLGSIGRATAGGQSTIRLGRFKPSDSYADSLTGGTIFIGTVSGTSTPVNQAGILMQTTELVDLNQTALGLSPDGTYGMRIFDNGRDITTTYPVRDMTADNGVGIHPDGTFNRSVTDGSSLLAYRLSVKEALVQGKLLSIGDDFENTYVEKFAVTASGSFGPGAYKLPATDGTSGYVLKTDGGGSVTWQPDDGGVGGAAAWESTAGQFRIAPASITLGDQVYIRARETDGASQIAHLLDTDAAFTVGTLLSVQQLATEVFRVEGSGQFGPAAYLLPAADGTLDQVLTTDGAGAVTFQDLPAPPSVPVDSVFGRTGAVVAVAGDYGPTLGGTGQTTYAAGDLLYASAADTLARLGAGTDGFVLTLNAGLPIWQATQGAPGSAAWQSAAGKFEIVPSEITAGDQVSIQSEVVDGATAVGTYITSSGGLATPGAAMLKVDGGSGDARALTFGPMLSGTMLAIQHVAGGGIAYIGSSNTNGVIALSQFIGMEIQNTSSGNSHVGSFTNKGNCSLRVTAVTSDPTGYGSTALMFATGQPDVRPCSFGLSAAGALSFDCGNGTTPANSMGDTYIVKAAETGGAWEFVYDGTKIISYDAAAPGVRINDAFTLPIVDGAANQVLTTNGAGAVSWQAGGGGGGTVAWNDTFYAFSYEPPSVDYATTGTRTDRPILKFSNLVEEYAVWTWVVPATYAGGDLNLEVRVSSPAGTGGTTSQVRPDFEVNEGASTDIDNPAWTTGVAQPVTTLEAATTTVAVTITAVALGTIVAGQQVRIRIARPVFGDLSDFLELHDVFVTEV
jgi:hypothetical protein